MSFRKTMDQRSSDREVVDRILRRAEVAKMTRLLQNSLALANFKTQHGWEDLALDKILPKVDGELKRKRPASSSESISDSSSAFSDPHFPPPGLLSTSPGPVFSDPIHETFSGLNHKRRWNTHNYQMPNITPISNKRARTSMSSKAFSGHGEKTPWQDIHALTQSSPLLHRHNRGSSRPRGLDRSFVSKASTRPNRPESPVFQHMDSDEEEGEEELDLPVHSFQISASQRRISPPRTPPPSRARSARFYHASRNANKEGEGEGEGEGADLLLYLATSPSPANRGMKARVFPPSTPPSRNEALPSSMMTTPGGGGSGGFLYGAGQTTPSPSFNFADFVNITPSPAQRTWHGGQTPSSRKTPREARQRLNFDSLLPPNSSPNMNGSLSSLHGSGGGGGEGGGARNTGLGMDLGGELIAN
ncbi:MAG: hypothetical protein M1829_004844 [Trizodia sp. TS-e1964]|nr:MAG: hypothetical protein M1829_004844 [Trizodia sp. TS-e1964]